MAFIPVPNGVRIVVAGMTTRAPVVNVLHAGVSVEATPTAVQEWAQGMYDSWEARILPLLSSSYRLQNVTVYDLASESGALGSYGEAAPTGGVGGSTLPYDSAVCVTFRTAARGRSGRGRIYLAPFAEADADAGEISQALATALFDAWTLVRSDMATVGLFQAVVSYYTGGQPRAQGLLQPVIAHEIRSRIMASQARRAARP